MKKISGTPNWVRNCGFCHFLKVASLVFLDIAQDCSLGQCLTSSRAETSKKKVKKKFITQIGAEMIFSILMSSSVYSNLLVLVLKEDLRAIHYQRPLKYLEKHFLLHDLHQMNIYLVWDG